MYALFAHNQLDYLENQKYNHTFTPQYKIMRLKMTIKTLSEFMKEQTSKVILKKSDLQGDEYNYTWTRDSGDGENTGTQDRIRVDKDEGYEVLHFIETLINDNDELDKFDVHRIEDILQGDDLSDVDMRDDLEEKILKELGLD